MSRKISSLAVAVLIAASLSIAAPAQAATKISNGVTCKKAGATIKTSAGTYRCATNPTTTSKRLTWLSTDCLTTGSSYLNAKAKLPLIKTATDKTIADLDADIIVQQKALTTTLADIEAYKVKIAGINAKIAPLKVDTASATRNAATIKAYEGAIKNYETAITTKTRITSASGTITRSITRIQTARTQALAAYEGAKRDVVDGLDMTKLICTNGF
jgi:hypothetical protein